MLIKNKYLSSWPTTRQQIDRSVQTTFLSGNLLYSAFSRLTTRNAGYTEQGGISREHRSLGASIRGTNNISSIICSNGLLVLSKPYFAWWLFEANYSTTAQTSILTANAGGTNADAVLIGRDTSANLTISVEGTLVATITPDWTRPISLAVAVNSENVFWAMGSESSEVAQATTLNWLSTVTADTQRWYAQNPRVYALGIGHVYDTAMARQLAADPLSIFAPQQIYIPTAAAPASSLPTLSLPTYVTGSVTATGARGRVTATAP